MLPMPNRRSAAVLLTLALLGSACSSSEGAAPEGPAGIPAQATNATSTTLLPVKVAELPRFDLQTYEALLGQLQGTPVVVNIWASWCGPCNEEAPFLASAGREYGDEVQFLGVDILDSRGDARGFLAQYGWSYPSVFDPTGSIRDGLGVLGQPATLFYSADGTLVSSYTGAIPEAELERRIDQIRV